MCALVPYRELYNRIDVSFYDKNTASDPGFTLTLNQKMSYLQVGQIHLYVF